MEQVELKNISKIYGSAKTNEVRALDNISFSIPNGQFVVILGASGAGKSTLLNIIGGMDVASSGQYYVNGKEITKLNDHELGLFRRHDIGFVFQFYNLVQNLTAKENVELATQICKNAVDAESANV